MGIDILGAVQELSVTDWVVTVVFCYFIYRVVLVPRFKKRDEPPPPDPELPPMKKQGSSLCSFIVFMHLLQT
jgi:hypothetical protein